MSLLWLPVKLHVTAEKGQHHLVQKQTYVLFFQPVYDMKYLNIYTSSLQKTLRTRPNVGSKQRSLSDLAGKNYRKPWKQAGRSHQTPFFNYTE